MLATAFFIIAAILFVLASFSVPAAPAPHLGWIGLAFFAAAHVVPLVLR